MPLRLAFLLESSARPFDRGVRGPQCISNVVVSLHGCFDIVIVW